MLQYVQSVGDYSIYFDTDRGNYKIKDTRGIIANPSTYEQAVTRLGTLSGKVYKETIRKCEGCTADNCNDCERYN